MHFEPVIGLEVHIQLMTQSKIFSPAATRYGASPNTQACAIDLGLPGVLPMLNPQVLDMAIAFGLAVDATIHRRSIFARKNYYYPDLPKGYQISQHEHPIVSDGHLDITLEDGTQKRITISRAHLEEDAGKSLHESIEGMTGIDLNRAGIPLLEIVTAPDFRSAKEATIYLKALHTLVRYLGICDGNLQEGSFRCDANVSVRPRGAEKLGTRAEIKNLNSFRFVEKAIDYEIERHIAMIESGQSIVQETRLYDTEKHETRSLRNKEDAQDYRYFPDPDLPPLEVEVEHIERVRSLLPELPHQKSERFQKDYALSRYDALVLSASKTSADYFEQVVQISQADPKMVANWINGSLAAFLNEQLLEHEHNPISVSSMATLMRRIQDETLSGKTAKIAFEHLCNDPHADVDVLIDRHGLRQVTDTAFIERVVDEVLANHPDQLAQYRSGKDRLFAFFVGQVMKATQGKANPAQLNALLKQKLDQGS